MEMKTLFLIFIFLTLTKSSEGVLYKNVYWDVGNCGPHGDDGNWNICNERQFDCPQMIDAPGCDSGYAEIANIYGDGTSASYRRGHCHYYYFVEYQCTAIIKYLKIADKKTCPHDSQEGGVYNLDTADTCREQCYSAHNKMEMYFTLRKNKDNGSTGCLCFENCDVLENDKSGFESTVYEIVSEHVGAELLKYEGLITELNRNLDKTKKELETTQTELADTQREADSWEARYTYVHDHIDGTLKGASDQLFDKAEEDNPVASEAEVGVVNCNTNGVDGNAWFDRIFTLAFGALFGAGIGAFIVAGTTKMKPEEESLL